MNPPYEFDAVAGDEAAKVGCYVVYPADNQLQIDIDSDEAFALFEKRMAELYRRTPYPMYQLSHDPVITPSKSGLPHRHVTLTFSMRVFSEWERIGMQLALGSDPTREALNALRLASGIGKPSRFFEPNSIVGT